MKKVLLVATVQSHIAQFHKPLIEILKRQNYTVHVAARNNLNEKNGLELIEPDAIFNIPFERNPISINNIKSYLKLKRILQKNNYDIVHCNTPMGGVITRLAARKKRSENLKVFYTVHGFHFFKGASQINWAIYYPVEKILAKYTDKIITISEEDFVTAEERRFNTKIERIHGVGANTDKYYPPSDETQHQLRNELNYTQRDFICICTGELNNNKNQITLLKAIVEIIGKIPNFKLIMAGNGPNFDNLKMFIQINNLENHVKLIGYVTNLEKYVMISDIVISASIREGLGLNIIEAMLCEKAVVASRNRGHNELIQNNINGLLVDSLDYEGYAQAIMHLYNNKSMRKSMGKKSKIQAQKYTKEYVMKELENIYEI